LVDTTPDRHLHCWCCGVDSHTKKDPNCPKFPRDSPQPSKAKKKEEIKVEVKVEVKPKKNLKCNDCGGTNHDDDHCFQLHPELWPASYV